MGPAFSIGSALSVRGSFPIVSLVFVFRKSALLLGGLAFWFAAHLSAASPLVYQESEGYRHASLEVPQQGRAGFILMPPERTGIAFTNLVPSSRSLTNHILLNGSGVAAGDFDQDGWCDLFLAGLGGKSTLYRNLGGWKFQEVTREAGIDCSNLDATGAVLADCEGDGDLDLLVSSVFAGVHCYINEGQAQFRERTDAAGLGTRTAAMTLALADIDGDGDLDLYVSNYRSQTLRDAFRMQIRVAPIAGRRIVTMVNGQPLTGPDLAGWVTLDPSGNIRENGQADVLYRNDGTGTYTALSFTNGAFLDERGLPLQAPLYDWTLTAMFRDLNGDGAPDLYACGDLQSPDRIWINRGDGRFQALPPLALRKTSAFSMGVDCADLNRDGFDEIFVTDMISRDHRLRQVQVSDHSMVPSVIGAINDRPQVPRNTLFLNRQDGEYAEAAYRCGLDASEWSWSPVFLDVDLDGYEDLLIATGFERDVQDVDIAKQLEAARRSQRLSDAEALRLRAKFPRLALPNLAFRNHGDMTFEEVGATWGFDTIGVSQGVALADLDNDGDLDVVVNNMNGAAGIYRNDSPAPRLSVRLRGQAPNTRGIGARIRVTGRSGLPQQQEIQSGGRYLSSDDTVRTFAAGSLTNVLTVEVHWRSGKQSRASGLRPNQLVEISEPAGPLVPASPKTAAFPKLVEHGVTFQDVSSRLAYLHHEDPFDDLARQPLLPRKLSQLGPGVAWLDADGDGWDDLAIGSGKGGALAVFKNDRNGAFQRLASPLTSTPATRDQTGIASLQLTPDRSVLLVGSANYEDSREQDGAVLAYDCLTGNVEDLVPATSSSSGPLAVADYDGDGALDLFVGGRVVAGRFPEPASSRLFHNVNGKLVEDEAATPQLRGIGLVSGAVWSDLDGKGYPDLILACEWGPLRIFRNDHGRLTARPCPVLLTSPESKQASPTTLADLPGWWNGVATGDFDGDGRLDIVASNWGRNHRFQRFLGHPLRLYFGDWNGLGGVDQLETHYESGLETYVPWHHFGRVGPALPFVAERFTTFREFGSASIGEILGTRTNLARRLEASWLSSTLFLNQGDHFQAVPLPDEAQLAPAFATCVADLDNDGREDLVLSQNFFATDPETGRYDGGRGLWLRGDGHGGFQAVAAGQSGIRIYGEQRGAAVADFDHDGRTDLCVSQNGAAVRLFKNVGANPGIRLRLQGPPGNPRGIGAQILCSHVPSSKEIHAGSGYWSQNSAVVVLPKPSNSAKITVRWPGGKTTTATLSPGDPELVVHYPSLGAQRQ